MHWNYCSLALCHWLILCITSAERAVRMDDDEDVERLPGPDPVTAQMLLRREAERLLETYDDTVQNCRLRTRNTIRQRLNDMNAQFSAIEAMSGHMEEDFQNTKLVSMLHVSVIIVMQGPVSMYRYCHTNIGNPLGKIGWLQDFYCH